MNHWYKAQVEFDDEGVSTWTSSDWTLILDNGILFKFPRSQISSLKKKQDETFGVYILIGYKKLYVGKGQFCKRASDHNRKKDWWKYVIIVTKDGGLTENQRSYIENKWIEKLRENKRYTVDNVDGAPDGNLTRGESDKLNLFSGTAEKIIEQACNEPVFQKKEKSQNGVAKPVKPINPIVPSAPVNLSSPIGEEFLCKNGYCEARGIYLGDGKMKVLKGSKGRLNPTPGWSRAKKGYFRIWDELIKEKKLLPEGNHYVFQEDVEFKSPSAASAVIRANASNGYDDWKKNDRRLGEFIPKPNS